MALEAVRLRVAFDGRLKLPSIVSPRLDVVGD
jgi:hypothetical protein